MKKKEKLTPEQVKNGKANYSFDAFLSGLWEDVRSTLSPDDSSKMIGKDLRNGNYEKNLRDVFIFMYRICYLAAVNLSELKEIMERTDPESKNIMEEALKSNKENIALLRAIFFREISRKLERGLTKKQALKGTIEECKSAFLQMEKLRDQQTNGI